jgi:AraC-like DNA-binding protein
MDVHIVPGVKAKDVAAAHRLDLLHQHDYNCNCITYWIDEHRETVFCLIEAPEKDAVEKLHSQSHGLIPNKIIEVRNEVVESFLGRIYDPENAEMSGDLKIINDPSFRVLLVTSLTDPVLLKYIYGLDRTNELLNHHNCVIRKNMLLHGGREAEHCGGGFIISFDSAAKAVACALAIHHDMPEQFVDALGFRIAVNAGEPIENSNQLFGDTIQLAFYLCSIARSSQVAMSSRVKDLIARDHHQFAQHEFLTLPPQDEQLLRSLFAKLGENWQNAEFDMEDYCQNMAMSKSQLYRKCISLTGLSPNILLKEFRLEKAKDLMKKQHYNISQITFESGFTSPSYFTKCFKQKYGLLPMAYIELLY